MNHKPKNMLLKFFRFFTICFVIMLLASCYSKEDDKEPYRIKFYDDRIYVDSVELIEGTTISSEQIRNVEMKLNLILQALNKCLLLNLKMEMKKFLL